MSPIDTSLRERKRMVVRGSTAYQDSNGNRRIKSAEQMQKISDALNALGIDHTVRVRPSLRACDNGILAAYSPVVGIRGGGCDQGHCCLLCLLLAAWCCPVPEGKHFNRIAQG